MVNTSRFVTACTLFLWVLISQATAAQTQPRDRFAGTVPDIGGVWGTIGVINPKTGGRGMADPPLSKKGQAIVDDFRGQYNLEGMEPNAHCVEPGMPTIFFGYGTAPIEIVQQPQRVTVLAELGMQVRRIYLDRTTPPDGFPHTRVGYSTAHWEKDTLVVDTTLLTEWYLPRWPHSNDTTMQERIYLKRAKELKLPMPQRFRNTNPIDPESWILVNELTMTDAALYDAPQKMAIYFRPLADDDILEDNCIEGLWWDEMEKLKHNPG